MSLGKTDVLQEVAPAELTAFKLHAAQTAEQVVSRLREEFPAPVQSPLPPSLPPSLPTAGPALLSV